MPFRKDDQENSNLQENRDPDREQRLARLRAEEARLREQVERERDVVLQMRAEKELLEQAIRDRFAAKGIPPKIFPM